MGGCIHGLSIVLGLMALSLFLLLLLLVKGVKCMASKVKKAIKKPKIKKNAGTNAAFGT